MIVNTVIEVLFVAWGVIAVLSTLSAWRYTWGLSFNLLWLDYCRTISYVIGPDGRILYSYADSNPVKHVENTLSFVKRWREEHN
jgi:peroxiredoxin